jgi:hypothetical protein
MYTISRRKIGCFSDIYSQIEPKKAPKCTSGALNYVSFKN